MRVSPSKCLGVLVPPYAADPGVPEDRPIGRAALRLEARGIRVVFGHHAEDRRLWGVRARPGAWEVVEGAPLAAAYDRFASRSRPEAYHALRAGLGGLPVANPRALLELCTDKLRCQRQLDGLRVPEVEADPSAFAATLARWGAGFLKPRFGSFGEGVRRVSPGDPLPAHASVGGSAQPMILQRAIEPPQPWAGVACRVLVQRHPDGGWRAETPVARCHRSDPVVNAARGASVVPLEQLAPGRAQAVAELAEAAAQRLSALEEGDLLVELGIDVALDADLTPWILEINGRPRGRLGALARLDPAQHAHAHAEACARPLNVLAAWFS